MKLSIDFSGNAGPIKPMNAVNNGPVYRFGRPNADVLPNNLELYRDANIPYARTHDASFEPEYGEEHTVDTNCIFTDFDADPHDPASYDFTCTDSYLNAMLLAGTKPYYRLGCKIEGHLPKKYAANPPKDFHKWAVICEHIVAHYNHGWADGFEMGIEYWEVWNEVNDRSKNNWTGTDQEYFNLYAITATHLKGKFPEIKIGGPSTCFYDEPWLRPFLEYMKEHRIPVDFCSFHNYERYILPVVENIHRCRKLLDELGFPETEVHLNEWNYAVGWGGTMSCISREVMATAKGAAFYAAYISACQYTPLDLLMYYDFRPGSWNGAFDTIWFRAKKGYYPFKVWGEMRTLSQCCECDCGIPDIYAAAAKGEGGEMAMITYYSDDENAVARTFTLELKGVADRRWAQYTLDETHDMTHTADLFPDEGKLTLTVEPNTVLVLH